MMRLNLKNETYYVTTQCSRVGTHETVIEFE